MVTLAEASLTEQERRVVERFVALLERELGDDLKAVWLYGSRARGERPHEESDVDVLVIASDDERHRERVWRLLRETAEAEGGNPYLFTAVVTDPEWLAERRSIDAFFVREVDRDRIVIVGDPVAGLNRGGAMAPDGLQVGSMSPRSSEYIEKAREHLAAARLVAGSDVAGVSVHDSYYAMFYAARGALSELDLFAKTHSGTWTPFSEHFVATGRFDPQLRRRADEAQTMRIGSDYEAKSFSKADAEALLADAKSFVDAVAAMFGERG